MSDDLLTRAAKALRHHAHAVPATMVDRWSVRSDSVAAQDHTAAGTLVVQAYNPRDDAPVLAFIALMDPAVALALADLLDEAAGVHASHGLSDDDRWKSEHALARAILREPT